MSELKDLLSIEECHCGRSYCEYFAGGVGEYGESYSEEEVIKMLADAKKLVSHLEALVSKQKATKE